MEREKKDFPSYADLDYWKDYITMHNVLACELSYPSFSFNTIIL